jgi:hypothetical protein
MEILGLLIIGCLIWLILGTLYIYFSNFSSLGREPDEELVYFVYRKFLEEGDELNENRDLHGQILILKDPIEIIEKINYNKDEVLFLGEL